MTKTKPLRKLQVVDGGRAKVATPKDHYEVLFENANDAIMVINVATGTITSANHAALELTGYLHDELVGRSVDVLMPKDQQLPQHSNGLSHTHLESSGFFEDIVLTGKDSYLRFVSASVRTVKLGGKTMSLCILRDVAEKKNMERDLITKHSELRNAYVSLEKANADLKAMQETLVQSGKLAALGELAAGIAHELNQPLTAVKGFAQEAKALILNGLSKEDMLHHLDEVVKGADKMEKIISHLRNFTRKSTEDFTMVDVHTIIEESLLLIDKQLRSRGISVVKNFMNDLPPIYCNPFQLEQVFINLATNARDAIEATKNGRGTIKIQTMRSKADDFIEIKYEDDGCGISDNAKGKIFNPFFTTKEVGEGMGLGLSISYGILTRLNASIVVESAVGKGTVFTIKLPADYRKH